MCEFHICVGTVRGEEVDQLGEEGKGMIMGDMNKG